MTVSSNNFIFLSMTPSFHKIDHRTFNGIISGLLFTTFVNILPKLRYFRVEIICKLVTRVIQYFCFPDIPMKGWDILDLEKGGILKKGVLTNYEEF